MEIVAVITLAVALAGSIGVIVWLVRGSNGRVDQLLAKVTELQTANDVVSGKTLEAERSKFAQQQAEQALTAEKAHSAALEDFIGADVKQTSASVPLAPDDVAGRLLRFVQKQRPTSVPVPAAAGGQVPAKPSGDVHANQPTSPTGAAGLPAAK